MLHIKQEVTIHALVDLPLIRPLPCINCTSSMIMPPDRHFKSTKVNSFSGGKYALPFCHINVVTFIIVLHEKETNGIAGARKNNSMVANTYLSVLC